MKSKPTPKKALIKKEVKKESFTVVAIGASAGGLEAVTEFLQNLSSNTGMAYIYVQHLSPDHKSLLTELLSSKTKMKVQEIEDMEKMEPNNVYVIPYNKEIEVTNGHIKLIPRPKNKTTNLSVDVLFSSLAETHKSNVIGIILSGNGHDGCRGLKEIKFEGGITFAQDDSAKFNSMPRSAINEGVVDFVLSPKEIAKEIISLSKHSILKKTPLPLAPEDEIENNDPDLKIILQLLHKRKNVDFSHYKMSTFKRRMLRRMLIHKVKTVKQYVEIVAKKNSELDLLYEDLLINVTYFFRDADAFMLLKKTVLSKLLNTKAPGETLRIWVAACATGEEVYSIAMSLIELQDSKSNNIPFQIFASDLSAEAIRMARSGEYTAHQLKNVSPKRLQRFFSKTKDKYRISQPLRDVCIFAQHNILRDPPFSRMDFISCRNFLIYLEATAQRKAITTFHYALNEGGCLMLGKSETIGASTQFFAPFNKTYKIYSRKNHGSHTRIPDLIPRIQSNTRIPKNINANGLVKKIPASTNAGLGIAFDSVLLSKYVPASVIINYEMEILQFRGQTSSYLMQSSGKASFNILKMVNTEMVFELRNAIHHAIKSKQTVRKAGIEIDKDIAKNTFRIVNLEVAPLNIEGEEPMLVVVFSGHRMEIMGHTVKGTKNNSAAKDRRIKKLEEELASARYDMGSITHDQEAVNEELQSANEEAVSSNEELQSLNEELETSKEEIESTNEELTTTNQELYARIKQVEELYTYYEGILAGIQEPMLILDRDLRVKSANTAFYKMFQVSEDETVGKSLFKLGYNQWSIPQLRELLEDIVSKNKRFQDFEAEQTFPKIGNKTMLLNAHGIILKNKSEELVVLTIKDVTEIKRLASEIKIQEEKVLEVKLDTDKKMQEAYRATYNYFRQLVKELPAAVYSCDVDGYVDFYNNAAEKVWGRKPVLGVDQWCGSFRMFKLDGTELPHDECPMAICLKKEVAILGEEIIMEREDGTRSIVMVYPQPEFDLSGELKGAINMVFDITAQATVKDQLVEAIKNAEQKTQIAENAVQAKQQFLSNMSHEIRTPMNAIIGFTNVMLKTELSPKQKEFLRAIKTSGEALTVLINDILDLAKVDAGKMTFEKRAFKMEESITAMLHLFETKIQEKNLELVKEYDTKIPKVLVGDPVRLHQIILNLVSNAEKFTTQGKITVSVNLLHEDDEKVTIEFTIADTGIGIAEENLKDIFENFQQASTGTSRLYGGTGLGLAIVKQLVEPQGGTIRVKSKIDKGSTFSFILDFEKTNAVPEEENGEPKSNPEIKDTRVLVVEDVPLNQLLIKTLLDDFGFKHDSALNGKLAIEKLEQEEFDIILMDLQMPEMDGFEATKHIRNALNSKIPIIALTADVTTVDFAKCKAFGMDDYLSKPVDEKLLYQKIASLTKNAGHIELGEMEENQSKYQKYVDLKSLNKRTKSNPKLMGEIISIYLEQTPPLIKIMKQSLHDKDWNTLQAAVHKMIPSFTIMGISKGFENIARRVQEDANNIQLQANGITHLVLELENICTEACKELEEEFNNIQSANK